MRPRHLVLAALVAALSLGALPAVASPRPPALPDPAQQVVANTPAGGAGEEQPARVTVAVIDSGINPYHEFFIEGGQGPYAEEAPSAVTPEVLAEFGIGEDQILSLTTEGSIAQRMAADRELWDSLERGVPYWFEGTNVIGISFASSAPFLEPTPDKNAHGTGTAGAVLNANPEAVVVAVEGINDDAEDWAFTHPAVDILTTSYGPIGSIPVAFGHLSSSYEGVVELGKAHFGAVDNTPALSPVDATGGPWWAIGVAGYHEETGEGREPLSGSLPDFVGDFTQTLPYCMRCAGGESSVSGTSFATPRAAGTASAILLEARRAAGHVGGITADGLMVDAGDHQISVWDLRRALEESAVVPDAGPDALGSLTLPTLPVGEYALLGWGAVTPDPTQGVIDSTLTHLGIHDGEARTKSAEACTFMTALIEARVAHWGTSPTSDGMGDIAADGYQRC